MKHGTLATRKPATSEIPRTENGIMHLALNWEKRAIVPYTTVNSCNAPLKNMISKEMRPSWPCSSSRTTSRP